MRRALEAAHAHADGSGIIDPVAEAQRAPVRNKALRLLDQRARSREELRRRIAENPEFEPQIIDEVLGSLESSGLIDDHTFATEWVRQRAARRGKSRRVLDKELRDKGVAEHHRASALEQVSDDDEVDMAQGLAEKKARTIKNPPADRAEHQKNLRRVLGVLARRGFAQHIAMPVATSALNQRYAELEQP
nr:regulatory protein RecX [Corynebacterium sp. TAE3-ERU12]